ncbi:hypothetical protein QBC34DRAFT_411167 [Podospora aff. communis PSN243]|uniref:Uncharacterized protein n=1 Tax=Podospora aff. communis PSN243 TaxID=3040156 RepID=A0AAV9GH64_9PEZI|nr:hypothetical protein QBC34DRAFT_411167 [Podospora aff. communis PSN243]
MRTSPLFLSLASLAAAQDTSRIRSRTSTGAVCTNTGAAVTATATFSPLLSVHLGASEECPQSAALGVHYHNGNDVGCCTQSAVLTTATGGQLACCGCGTTCTGSVPGVVDWTFSAGQFVTTTGTAGTGTSPTASPTSAAAVPRNVGYAMLISGLVTGALAVLL